MIPAFEFYNFEKMWLRDEGIGTHFKPQQFPQFSVVGESYFKHASVRVSTEFLLFLVRNGQIAVVSFIASRKAFITLERN